MISYTAELYGSKSKKPTKIEFRAKNDENMRLRIIDEMKKAKKIRAKIYHDYVDNLGLPWFEEWEIITFKNGMFWTQSLHFDEPAHPIDPKDGEIMFSRSKASKR